MSMDQTSSRSNQEPTPRGSASAQGGMDEDDLTWMAGGDKSPVRRLSAMQRHAEPLFFWGLENLLVSSDFFG